MMQKHKVLEIKNVILLPENRTEELPVQVYHVRFNYNFLIGFLMNKTQSRRIMEDLYKYIQDKLNFDAPKK